LLVLNSSHAQFFFKKKKDGKNGTNKVKVGTRIVKPKSKDNQRASEH
jgi:hypothetical protein